MSDLRKYGLAEDGTYSTTGPSVDLDGTIPTEAAIGQLFDTALADSDPVTVTVRKDQTNWKVYSGAVFTSGTPDTLSFAAATLEASAGTISDSDAVMVLGLEPDSMEVSAPSSPTDSGEIGQWAWSSPFLYKYVATNTWVRLIPESSW